MNSLVVGYLLNLLFLLILANHFFFEPIRLNREAEEFAQKLKAWRDEIEPQVIAARAEIIEMNLDPTDRAYFLTSLHSIEAFSDGGYLTTALQEARKIEVKTSRHSIAGLRHATF